MTVFDDLNATVAAVQAAYQTLSDDLASEVAKHQTDNQSNTARITALQSQVDNLQKALDDCQNPPPPPPTRKAMYGGNFGSGADETKYPKPTVVARLFPGNGLGTDIKTKSNYKEAVAGGATYFMVDVKSSTDVANVGTLVKSFPDPSKVYMAYHHEPEDEAPASWKTNALKVANATRAAGGIPCAIFTSTILTHFKGQDIAQYLLPAGTLDAIGFDLYPRLQSVDQPAMFNLYLQAMQQWSVNRLIVGEYGAYSPTGGETQAVAWIKEFKTWFDVHGEAACYWSQGDDVLTQPRADAWFA